jgi:putative transposase
MNIFHRRQGQMHTDTCYFYTQTIQDFKHLLSNDYLKLIVIHSLQYLVNNKLVKIYGYVIMPNHIHLLWCMLKQNGNESPAESFSKFTAHQFRKYLPKDKTLLIQYKSKKEDRDYQFWKRDPLAVPISTDNILIDKLNYIHHNPVKPKWALCELPEEYKWSSAKFYVAGEDEYKIITHFRE